MASVEHNFSFALSTWKDINLAELQKTLDAQGLEIVENQKESVIGRKALSDRTKDFKKIPDDEKLNAWKGLLKSYQVEIDNLTKRSKVSENAFLNLYKRLAEAPDPYPLLEAAVEQTIRASQASQLESEVTRLREENASLNRKLNDVPAVEAARKKAEARAQQLEEKMEETVTERVSQRENELDATYDERMRNYETREQDLVRQLSLAKTQLRDMRNSNETNQAKLLDQTQRQDHETVAKLAELDMIVAELERANNRVVTAERRNELLRAEIEAVRSGREANDRAAALEEQVEDLKSEMERLSRVLENQKFVNAETEGKLKQRIEELSKELNARAAECEALKARLRKFDDYDEIKRELEIMKYVEFGGLEEGETNEVGDYMNGNTLGLSLPDPNPEKANAQQNKSLEALLHAKNKRIMEELTRFRVMHGELESSLRSANEELSNAKAELDKQRALNDRLENDLMNMNLSGKQPDKPDGDFGDKQSVESSVRTTPIPFTSSADTSILPIVTSQRDRFRQRNAELEEELRKQFQIISDLRSEARSLQSDNLKLYEKVRYMQSYRENNDTVNPLPAARQDDLSKYHARYEEAMNPFEAFRGREAARAFQALNPLEKVVLSLTRTILGNKRARNIFIIYALALHILVMFTTYECTTSSGTQFRTEPPPVR